MIELIVALAVLALVSMLIVEALRLGFRAWDGVNSRLSRVEAVALTQHVLRQRIQQVYPYGAALATSTRIYPLVGQAHELSFSAPGPHSLSGQMLRYRVYLDRGATGTLMISWRSDPGPQALQQADEGSSAESLLEGVNEAAFEYFDGREPGSGTWMPSWIDKPELPALVRLRLRFVRGAAGDWPDFVVRPRIDIPADCQFDLVSRRCR